MGRVTGDGWRVTGRRCRSGSDVSVNRETTRRQPQRREVFDFLQTARGNSQWQFKNSVLLSAVRTNSNRHKVSVFRGLYFRSRLLDRTWSERVSWESRERRRARHRGESLCYSRRLLGFFAMWTKCSRALWLKIVIGALCTSHPSFRLNWHYEELTDI